MMWLFQVLQNIIGPNKLNSYTKISYFLWVAMLRKVYQLLCNSSFHSLWEKVFWGCCTSHDTVISCFCYYVQLPSQPDTLLEGLVCFRQAILIELKRHHLCIWFLVHYISMLCQSIVWFNFLWTKGIWAWPAAFCCMTMVVNIYFTLAAHLPFYTQDNSVNIESLRHNLKVCSDFHKAVTLLFCFNK